MIEPTIREGAAAAADIKVNNWTVTLKGHVRTWREREDAGLAAWAAPGVAELECSVAAKRIAQSPSRNADAQARTARR
jgi:osmotically-inducible protein OsmY